MLKSSTFGMIKTLLLAWQLNFLSVFIAKPNTNIKDHFDISALDACFTKKTNSHIFLTLHTNLYKV